MKGIYIIYKPKGPTSHDMIDEVRKIVRVKKVGHAGTLDPLASGVLIIGIGRDATRQLGSLAKHEKEYIATICFGMTSTTDDAEGQKKLAPPPTIPTEATIGSILPHFIGEIMQTPPIYSAIKIQGQAAYKLAREGIKPTLKPRKIFIRSIKLIEYNWPHCTIRVICGPGTYIRSLARDMGTALAMGGYLADLERTRIGKFTKDNALTLDAFKKWVSHHGV